jgi:hypothetical protein
MSLNMQQVVRLLHAGEVPSKPLNGKGERYSASTAKSIDVASGGCERRHWFEQVVGIDPPIGAALGIGQRVHGHIERALKKGVVLDPSPNASMEERLAARGLPHLPPPGTPGMHVEQAFKMPAWPNGPEFTGTIDLHVEPEGWAEAEANGIEAIFDSAELIDHKTTGSYHKYAAKGWALSERTQANKGDPARKFLDDDVQNIAYSTRLLRLYEVKHVNTTWLYFPKDGSAIVPVRAVMERMPTLVKWKTRVVPLIEKMHEQHKQRPALALVEANEEACDSFGGCPHRAYCVDYKATGARTQMGKLSAKLLEEHDEPVVTKSTAATSKASKQPAKEPEAPAMNPPTLSNPPPRATKSPFATMDKAGVMKDETPEQYAQRARVTKALADEDAKSLDAKSLDAKPTAPTGAGFALFLGCEPVVTKRPKVDFALFLQPILDRVAKAHKVASVGLVKYDGINHTSAAVEEWFADNGEEWAGANVVVPNAAFYIEVATRALYGRATAVSKAML